MSRFSDEEVFKFCNSQAARSTRAFILDRSTDGELGWTFTAPSEVAELSFTGFPKSPHEAEIWKRITLLRTDSPLLDSKEDSRSWCRDRGWFQADGGDCKRSREAGIQALFLGYRWPVKKRHSRPRDDRCEFSGLRPIQGEGCLRSMIRRTWLSPPTGWRAYDQ